MKNQNGKDIDLDFIVYEPVRRPDVEDKDNVCKEKEILKSTKKYSGLYNRGNNHI